MASAWGAFWGTRVMEIVKKHDSGGLVWKRIKLTTTRKANAKKRLRRVWQNEAVLRACSEAPPSGTTHAGAGETDATQSTSKQVPVLPTLPFKTQIPSKEGMGHGEASVTPLEPEDDEAGARFKSVLSLAKKS
nr:uncharacterized protein LOC109175281 [Ipomoea batatas]